ncbi:uncharacterized protein A4U43_C06F8940 [Asparagus officinalis]|uniref:Uncharacterized protein n=1 Tax=Asparagus officinalis TaxID=4686 RepID=A0A5P1ER66_ASPOF|nr:uncharacterized protein A4U43_C06F8940 [Asparagus officinalis]
MPGLRRSQTFRSAGSSGLVWDDRLLFGGAEQINRDESGTDGNDFREPIFSQSVGFVSSKINDQANCPSSNTPYFDREMVALQRSTTFRRSGSSGLVWDDKFMEDKSQKDIDEVKDEEEKEEFRGLAPPPPSDMHCYSPGKNGKFPDKLYVLKLEEELMVRPIILNSSVERSMCNRNSLTSALREGSSIFLDFSFVPMTRRKVSATTFRRSGSSGLVWDDKFLEENDQKDKNELKLGDEEKDELREMRPSQDMGSPGLPPPPPPRSLGQKFFRVIKKSMRTEQPKISSY